MLIPIARVKDSGYALFLDNEKQTILLFKDGEDEPMEFSAAQIVAFTALHDHMQPGVTYHVAEDGTVSVVETND